MIRHTDCTLHIEESDETNIALLLRGTAPSGEVAEALLIYTRAPDDVDLAFGHNRLFFTYKGEGTHGLVQSIEISVRRSILIRLTGDAATHGIADTTLVFETVPDFDARCLAAFQRLTSVTRTNFVFEVPIR
jgi:hypothetical protein